MNIKLGKILKIYTFYIDDNYEVTVKYDGNKMNITKIDYCYYDEYGIETEFYAKVNYIKKVKDKDNLENEMKIFIENRMDKMIDALKKVPLKLIKNRILK